MRFDDYPQYLRDILNCIVNIRKFRPGMTIEQVHLDRKTEAAVERELQIITEAAIRLDDQADRLCPGPDWRAIRGFGNHLRHAYDRLNPDVLRTILDVDLPQLEPQVDAAVARLPEKS